MSQTNSPPNSTGPPKKFLKKGEGLKRFAAFKPPLPVSANKIERRQTYVKFKLDNIAKKGPDDSHFLHPDILADESVNLITKVPKIAPPKIMHTPVRPIKTKSNTPFCRPNTPSPTSQSSPSPPTPSPPLSPSLSPLLLKRQPLRVKKLASPNPPSPKETGSQPTQQHCHQQQQQHQHQQKEEEQHEQHQQQQTSQRAATRSANRCLNFNTKTDLSSPSPGSCVLALGQQIQQIQSIVNHLEQKIKKCECEPKPAPPKRKSSRRRAASPETSESAEQPVQTSRQTRSTKQCPKPGSCVLALGQQIQQIQLTVNELKEGMKKCDCGAVLFEQKPASNQPSKPVRRSLRKTTLK